MNSVTIDLRTGSVAIAPMAIKTERERDSAQKLNHKINLVSTE